MEEVEPELPQHAILDAAKACDELFVQIMTAEQHEAQVIQRIPELFEASRHGADKAAFTLADLDDDYEQFRVFVGNTGIFATEQGSLDSRLREADDIRSGLVSLLESMTTSLAVCLSLLKQDKVYDDESGQDVLSDCSSDSEHSLLQHGSPLERTALELQLCLNHVHGVIDKLFRLAEIIRGSGVRNRMNKAATYVDIQGGIDLTEQFEKHFVPRVLEYRFRLKDHPLLNRLISAVTLRRRRFMYQSKHQKKLAYDGGHHGDLFPATAASPPSSVWPVEATPTQALSAIQHVAVPSTSGQTVPTRATTFVRDFTKHRAPSRMVSATVASGTAVIEIPPPPSISDRATHFLCPYCCILVPRDGRAPKLWRAHVIADLQPYICLEPDCPDPDIVFDDKEDWIEHQKWQHAMEWWCDGDNQGHPPIKFTDETGYSQHLRVSHVSGTDLKGISARVSAAGRPSLTPFGCCPFCDFLPEHTEHLTLFSTDDHVSQTKRAQQRLQNHIATHLLQIFLIALPDRIDLHDSNTDSDFPDLSQDSTALELSSTSSTTDETTDDVSQGDRGTDYAVFRVPLLDEAICNALWKNVWSSSQLRGSVRQTYTGVENDGALINMLASRSSNQPIEPLAHDYTVGWVCYRRVEFDVACEMLDRSYQPPETKHMADINKYAYGRVGNHNVVVVNALFEQHGHFMPALTVTTLLKKFPSIQMGLLVGIGSGTAAGDPDVRIGDVVVGASVDDFHRGGVTKILDAEIGPLRSPSPWLLESLFHLKANPDIERNIDRTLDNVMRGSRHLLQRYGQSAQETDILYHSDFMHDSKDDPQCKITPAGVLLRLKRHPDGKAKVHYGAIVSRGRMTKDAQLRDRLSSMDGVLCLDLEAGLSDMPSTFVAIRGICEYIGTRGIPVWQMCAASTAAAYAKELLNAIRAFPSETQIKSTALFAREPDLSPSHMQPSGNKEFMLVSDTVEYTAWIDPHASQNVLYITGLTGRSKPTVIESVSTHVMTRPTVIPISFSFCRRGSELERSASGMYRSLLTQLCQWKLAPNTFEQVFGPELPAFDNLELDFYQLKRFFYYVVRELGAFEIFCCIDGLNECNASEAAEVVAYLSWIAGHSDQVFKVLFTIREMQQGPEKQDMPPKVKLTSYLPWKSYLFEYIQDNLELEIYDTDLYAIDVQDARALPEQISRQVAENFLLAHAITGICNQTYPRGGLKAVENAIALAGKPQHLFKHYWTFMNTNDNRLDVLEALLDLDQVDVNGRDEGGCTALFRAAERGKLAWVETLLKHPDVLVNAADPNGLTPLSAACRGGHIEVAKLFLQREDLDMRGDVFGRSPLSHALASGRARLEKILRDDPRTENYYYGMDVAV